MWKFISKRLPVLRAIAVVGMVAALAGSVTYASLQSPSAALTGNSIQSATAGLQIGTASATSTAFSSSHTGFSFTGVVPGGPAMPTDGNTFYLKNNGTSTLNLKLTVAGTPANTSSVDLSKVNVVVTRVDTNTTQTASLQTLMDTTASGGLALTDTLIPASTGTQYKLGVSMTADAFSGSSATIGAFDFVFSGTAATN